MIKFRHYALLMTLGSAPALLLGCGADNVETPAGEDDLLQRASASVEAELKLLDGNADDLKKLQSKLQTEQDALGRVPKI